jgi:NADH-quinone oxidoreductase subunit G
LPAVPYTEREGTYTSGERRVQRFYPALPGTPGPRADFAIAAQLGSRLGLTVEGRAPSLIFTRVASALPAYAGLSYQKLAEVTPQLPIVGRSDMYYGGTSYDNQQGLGVQLPALPAATLGKVNHTTRPEAQNGSLLLIPVTRLYDQGALLAPSKLLKDRMAQPSIWLHPETAGALGLADRSKFPVTLSGHSQEVTIVLSDTVPVGVGLVPRSVGLPVSQPVAMPMPVK